MRFELLIKRIAEKTNTPLLEKALLERDLDQLPTNRCMVWTGKSSKEGLISKTIRGAGFLPERVPVYRRPNGVFQVNGRQEYVHRWVYNHFLPQSGPFRLTNLCGNTLCVNPYHWGPGKLPEPEEIPEPEISEDWTHEEALELLELYLTTNETLDPEHPLLIDIPEDLLREVLTNLNKKHLINP